MLERLLLAIQLISIVAFVITSLINLGSWISSIPSVIKLNETKGLFRKYLFVFSDYWEEVGRNKTVLAYLGYIYLFILSIPTNLLVPILFYKPFKKNS